MAYSLLASTLLTVVWVVYKCTLANAGCFRFNRIFLLLSIIITFILPPFILKPECIVDIESESIVLDLNPTDIVNVTQTVTEHIMPVWNYIVTLYLIGIGAMIIYFLVSLARLLLFIIHNSYHDRFKIIDMYVHVHVYIKREGEWRRRKRQRDQRLRKKER